MHVSFPRAILSFWYSELSRRKSRHESGHFHDEVSSLMRHLRMHWIANFEKSSRSTSLRMRKGYFTQCRMTLCSSHSISSFRYQKRFILSNLLMMRFMTSDGYRKKRFQIWNLLHSDRSRYSNSFFERLRAVCLRNYYSLLAINSCYIPHTSLFVYMHGLHFCEALGTFRISSLRREASPETQCP